MYEKLKMFLIPTFFPSLPDIKGNKQKFMHVVTLAKNFLLRSAKRQYYFRRSNIVLCISLTSLFVII